MFSTGEHPRSPRIGLVACSATKLPHAAPARDLYISPLFRKARDYCEAHYNAWFVLSAKHGLLAPDTEIEPYDLTLQQMSKRERLRWAMRVLGQIQDLGLLTARFDFHAGLLYRERLNKVLVATSPLDGLRIGEQLHWYAEQARRAA